MYFRNIDPDKEYPHTEIWDYINERDGGRCLVCGKQADEQHHIIMRSKCGKDTPNNIISLCLICHKDRQHGADRVSNIKLLELVYRAEKKFRENLI